MKTIFFGTSAFAVPSLHIVAKQTALQAVVTQPDRPAGRGHRLQPTPVKSAALELGLHVYEPTNLREFITELSVSGDYDCFILASYGKILPQALLDLPQLGALNIHPSLLPKYRGATPIQTALANGDLETGVTIMLMDAGMDTGDIVLQERFPISPDDNYGTLHDKLADFGAHLLSKALTLNNPAFPRTPQQGEPIITRPIRKDDLTLDLTWNAQRILNHIRAYAPQPAARTSLHGESIKITRAHLGDGPLHITAGDGQTIAIDELIAPNRGKESGAAYAARHGA